MNNLIIRKARVEELKVIQDLNYQLFVHDREFDSTLKMDWPYKEGEAYFKSRINGETSEEGEGACLVAEMDGEVVGYLAGQTCLVEPYRTVKRTELENTFVKEEFRGKGVGSKLFEEFSRWSKDRGVQRIKVVAYFENEDAISFYKKVGFKPYAEELEYEVK